MARSVVLWLWSGLVVMGCSSSPATSMDMGNTVRVTGFVADYSTLGALAEVKVCSYSPIPLEQTCTMTDANGAYVLTLPRGNLLLSYTKALYLPSLLEYVANGSDAVLEGHTIITLDQAMKFADAVLRPIDTSKPALTVQANRSNGNRLSGATVSAAFSPGDGPYYFDDMGLPSKTLTATSSSGLVAWFNSPPGDVEITVKNAAGTTCPPAHSWPGTAAGTSLAKLVAGYSTAVGGVCP